MRATSIRLPHRENIMHKTVMACLALFLTTATPVAWAQTDTAHTDTSVIGMPIYTADGMKIGQVTTLGRYRGESSMIGEVGRLMGFGTRRVLIPDTMATVQNDRVMLTITSDRVNELLEQPGQ
jgi:PRC-barrel domain